MKETSLSEGLVHKIPNDLANALIHAKGVAGLWNAITPIARNEFVCWVENAKQEATRAKRIRRTVEKLQQGEKRPCCWVGCIHRTDKLPSKSQVFITSRTKKAL
jgi:uncharacterized protein YdeI (YjbR/CyaY-like superfamily)